MQRDVGFNIRMEGDCPSFVQVLFLSRSNYYYTPNWFCMKNTRIGFRMRKIKRYFIYNKIIFMERSIIRINQIYITFLRNLFQIWSKQENKIEMKIRNSCIEIFFRRKFEILRSKKKKKKEKKWEISFVDRPSQFPIIANAINHGGWREEWKMADDWRANNSTVVYNCCARFRRARARGKGGGEGECYAYAARF